MNQLTPTPAANPVVQMKIAREIAADMRPIDEILKVHGISVPEWEVMSTTARFQELVTSAVTEWQSVSNTSERVKLKSLAFVEEALPEFYARAHDPKEPLSAKIEVLKAVSRLAGIGGSADVGGATERMVVNINLGADHKLQIIKDITPSLPITDGDEL